MGEKTVAAVLLSKGKDLIHKGEYRQAEKRFQEALDLFRKDNNLQGIAESETYLGIALQYQIKLNKAKEHFERALKLHEQLDYKPGISRNYTNLGSLALILSKDFQESLELHEKALNIAREAKDLRGESRALTNIGYLRFRQQKLEEALSTLKEAVEVADRAGYEDSKAAALSNMGMILFTMKRYEEALEKHKEVAKIFEKWGNKRRQAVEHRQMGLILEKLGRNEDACEQYEIAEKLYGEAGLKREKKIMRSMFETAKKRIRKCPSCGTLIMVPELEYCPICNSDLKPTAKT